MLMIFIAFMLRFSVKMHEHCFHQLICYVFMIIMTALVLNLSIRKVVLVDSQLVKESMKEPFFRLNSILPSDSKFSSAASINLR